MTKTVRAHTNIALIKYWGKKDKALKIPHNSSLSLTLDEFYTDTKVTYDDSLEKDVFYLDDKLVEDHIAKRVYWFMDEIRKKYNLSSYAKIESWNHVPKEAGLASSASAFAALAKAATLDLNLSDKELSRLSRLGSGSASRSIYGDFVRWNMGHDDNDSFAEPLDVPVWDDIRMVVCLVNEGPKPYLSSMAMDKTAEESVYYDSWVKQSAIDIKEMEDALKEQDIYKVGSIAQANALRMHASLLAIDMWYFEPETIRVMNVVRELQKTIPVYFTMDAGPNVKILTTAAYVDELITALGDIETVICSRGPAAYVY